MNPTDESFVRETLAYEASRIDTVGDFTGPAVALASRRRTRVVAAAVVAAGVVVAGGGVAAWTARPAPEAPLLPATSSLQAPAPSGTPSVGATPTATSPGPSALWALDGTVHVGDRTAFTLADERRVLDLAQLEEGRLLVLASATQTDQTWRLRVLDGTGEVVADLGTAQVGEAHTDGSLVAFGGLQGKPVRVVDTRGRTVATHAAGVLVRGVAGGRVLLVDDNRTGRSSLWDPRSGTETRVPDWTVGLSADGSRAFGSTAAAGIQGPRCWFVVDLTHSTSTKTPSRCGSSENSESFTPRDVSSDGRYLIGSSAPDGRIYSRLAVVDARSGIVVAAYGSRGAAVNGWSWQFEPESSAILLSRNVAEPASSAARNDLARCTVTLKCTQVADTVGILDPGFGIEAPPYVVGRPLPAKS